MALRVLTEIRSYQRGSKKRILLLDGEPHCAVSSDVLRELDLRPGDEIDDDQLDDRILSLSPGVARQRSLRLLSARERTSSEIGRRLRDDGYPTQVVTDTVGDLIASGLVDDRRYADLMARVLVVGRRLGRARARRELVSRGIPQDMAEEALDAHAPLAAESERAAELARRLVRSNDSVAGLASRLMRRGFSATDALAQARAVLPESNPDES